MENDWLTQPLGPMLWDAIRNNPLKRRYQAGLGKISAGRTADATVAPAATGQPAGELGFMSTKPHYRPESRFSVEPDPMAAALRARVAPPQAPAPAAPPAPPVAGTQAGMESAYADAFRQQQDREDQLAQASMGLVGMDDDRALIGDELGVANEDMDTAMPEGRDLGRVYVAANPLEFIGAAAKQIRGRNAREKALRKLGKINESRKGLIGGVIDALRSRGRPKVMDEEIPSGLPGASS